MGADRGGSIEVARELEANWGVNVDISTMIPHADEAEIGVVPTDGRASVSPAGARDLILMNSKADVRDLLPSVQCPTLVLHRTGDRDSSVEEGRFIAERIPHARFVELPGDTHVPWVEMERMLDDVEEFLTGTRPTPTSNRLLATVLFTDIVGSTDVLAQLGDAAWTSLLDRHHAMVRRELELFGGVESDTAGDGFLALFDGPARAIRAGLAIRDALRGIGLEIRVGVHTGEIEQAADGPRGIAVHLAARVLAAAGPGEVLVSQTTHDLVEGSGLDFEDRGEHRAEGDCRRPAALRRPLIRLVRHPPGLSSGARDRAAENVEPDHRRRPASGTVGGRAVLALRDADGVATRDAPVPALPLQDRLLRRPDS